MKLVTSNKQKLEEFKRILPEIEAVQGKDLREVDGTHEEVIIYKSIEAGKGTIVEDTILIVQGEEVVDVKWKIEELKKHKDSAHCVWVTILGVNNGNSIKLYKGSIKGIINSNSKDPGLSFDPYFIPEGSTVSLGYLDSVGKKDDFSARKKALMNLKTNNSSSRVKIKDIKEWEGGYQND